ncbi:MAG: HlyD family efflux transporter periplasmic adaptor subunit [Proteobacteria bacterium]|nr:HlyD family efflux transporter periplasmic adaptor subunit [Pseudomonadota bacterium]
MKPDTPPPADTKLFRDAVLKARSARSLGQIILTPHPRTTWLVVIAAVLGLLVVLFLTFGTYTRRATVTGQLVPSTGVIRVHTPQAGVVLERKVNEGQVVQKGDVLFVLNSDRLGPGARELQADIGQQVDERRRSLEAELARNKGVEAAEIGHLERRAGTLRAEQQSIERQMEQQRIRLKLAEDARKRYQGLADQDYIAREQLFQKEAELSEQQSRLQALERDALVAQRELATTLREIENTRVRYANQNGLLERGVSSAQQELTEVEARRRVVITAPESGRATLVSGEAGQSVDTTRPLLNLVPSDAKLEVRLYAPSRTMGFVRPGDAVLLRYQSFPYQKFGQHEGVVASVSNNAVTSTELAGFQIPDVPPGEPVYAIVVTLKAQNVTAYGKQWPLSAGMRLDADILQETRRLWEWMLEPLYSITGSM